MTVGSAKANVPAGALLPPTREEADKGLPKLMTVAAGHELTLGVALFTWTSTVVETAE